MKAKRRNFLINSELFCILPMRKQEDGAKNSKFSDGIYFGSSFTARPIGGNDICFGTSSNGSEEWCTRYSIFDISGYLFVIYELDIS